MEPINIIPMGKDNQTWTFQVEVGEQGQATKHKVIVDEDYQLKLTNGLVPIDELLNRSFVFLLSREPKESIMREFNLKKISEFFPEYEPEMKRMFLK